MTDPWLVQNSGQQINSEVNDSGSGSDSQRLQANTSQAPLQFEDNFAPTTTTPTQAPTNPERAATPTRRTEGSNCNGHQPLPDSDSYLRGLERKLQKIKKGSNLVEALAEKRNDCLRALLQSGDPDNNNAVLALDEPVNNPDFYRHLQPVQAISVGELVHIVNYDQLGQREPESSETQAQQSEKDGSNATSPVVEKVEEQ